MALEYAKSHPTSRCPDRTEGMGVNVCVYQGGLPGGGEGSTGFQVKVVVFFQRCLSHIWDNSFFSLDELDWAR